MKLTSYWLDTSQPFDDGSSKPLEGSYDVAVVGGGLTGSSAPYWSGAYYRMKDLVG